MLIKNGLLSNGKSINIKIVNDVIFEISSNIINGLGENTIDLENKLYISPGWIDMHVHAFPKYPPYYAKGDDIGVYQGVTTIVDAGSSGSNNIEEFFQYSKRCKSDIFSLLNISKIGLERLNELADLENIDENSLEEAIRKYKSFVIGLKARISASVVGENNINPLKQALEYKNKFKLPLMVHIGSAPPSIKNIIDLMDENCIITHSFNGKENNLFQSEENIKKLKIAIKKGLKLDLGHGSASFNFNIAEKAKDLGIFLDTISSDIYIKNKEEGPVYSLANVMSKFLIMGFSLEEIIEKVTKNPAKILNLKDRGTIEIGKKADFTIFQLKKGNYIFYDSMGNRKFSNILISPEFVIKNGVLIKGDKDEGKFL